MKKNILLLISATTAHLYFSQGSKLTTQSQPSVFSHSAKNFQRDTSIDTQYEYTDAEGGKLIIQNSLPKGGIKYTAPDGEIYYYAVFFTRIINETNAPLELNINFPAVSYELSTLPGSYFKLLLPPHEMNRKKELLPNYGLINVKFFLDTDRHKATSVKRTIDPKKSAGFYVVKLNNVTKALGESQGSTRAELSLKDKNLYYKIKNDGSKTNSHSSEMEINCGYINFHGLILKR